MICPDCRGRGRVRRRFLCFRWRSRCRTCRGTGVYPPNLVKAKRYAAPMREDDRDSRWTRLDGPSTSASRVADDDRFEVGSGGRSGGGGASASWDAPADSAPVIVDPFASDSGSGGGVVAADAADSESSGGETEADSGSDTASDGGSGTSY